MTRFENVGRYPPQPVSLLGPATPSYWLRLFSSQTFSRINIPTFLNTVILHTNPPMKMEQSLPKRRHIKF